MENQYQATTGVLLTNLGTPDAPTATAVRAYLAEFLADPRVIEIPKFIWWFILHGIILRLRPKKSAAKYASIWTKEGSPLLVISQKQAAAVQQQLGDSAQVKLGMRYGKPAITQALREFQAMGVRKIIVLPLYPQYAAATTGSTFDAIATALKTWRWVPEVAFINSYCDNPLYITALANSVREHIALHTQTHGKPQKIIFSYHGTPKRSLDLGDPYYCFCQKTTRLVQEKLGLNKDECLTTYQSRFGYAEWLQPYTDATLKELAANNIKNIAILSPAFSADCLETLEELADENRKAFLQAGGEVYEYIPALNDRADHIEALVGVIRERMQSNWSSFAALPKADKDFLIERPDIFTNE
jgi:protoporphyrin/coproporphyrin ferrochelatase